MPSPQSIMSVYNSIFLCCFMSQTLIYTRLSNKCVMPCLNSWPTESVSVIKWLFCITKFCSEWLAKQEKIIVTLTLPLSHFVFWAIIWFLNFFPKPYFSGICPDYRNSLHITLIPLGLHHPVHPPWDPHAFHLFQQHRLVFPILHLSGGWMLLLLVLQEVSSSQPAHEETSMATKSYTML